MVNKNSPWIADVDECTKPNLFPCNGICTNTNGSYDCECEPCYESGGADPKENKCYPKNSKTTAIALGIWRLITI